MTTGTYIPPTTPSDQPQQQPKQSSGCLKWLAIGCGAIFLLGIVAFAALAFFVFRVIKATDVYKGALHRAQSDPRVVSVLGSPIEEGFFVTGSVNVDNGEGHANIDFPISGPKGQASVHVVATRDRDAWQYKVLTVKPRSGPVIDLLSP